MTALGDFSSGDVLTAADLNGIGVWQAWTPTISANSGTITSYTIYQAKYCKINKFVVANINVLINNAGTGSTFLFSLPVTAAQSGGEAGFGRENLSTGISLNMRLWNSSTAGVWGYLNQNVIQTNWEILGTIIYEAA